jgi:hypothetical protein
MAQNPLDPQSDPFHPPEIPTEVSCLHCGKVYESYLIEWRVETCPDGTQHGFWCCPTPGCSGAGFGFDILPTDHEYQDELGGWIQDDDEGFDEGDLDEEDWLEEELDLPDHRGNGREAGSDPSGKDDGIPF